MSNSILPACNSRLQHDLAALTAEETAAFDIDVITRSHDPHVCDAAWLPYLAWESSISDSEGWAFAETEEAKRQLIAGYIDKHRHKGTPSVIRQLFRDLQLGEIHIIENAARFKWNGEANFDGTRVFGGGEGDWAKYAIEMKRPITNRQAQLIRELLQQIAPLRCELLYLDFRGTPIKWDGEIHFDGEYNFGAA